MTHLIFEYHVDNFFHLRNWFWMFDPLLGISTWNVQAIQAYIRNPSLLDLNSISLCLFFLVIVWLTLLLVPLKVCSILISWELKFMRLCLVDSMINLFYTPKLGMKIDWDCDVATAWITMYDNHFWNYFLVNMYLNILLIIRFLNNCLL